MDEIFEKSSPWMRLALCVNIHVKKALLRVAHNDIREQQVTAIPSDPTALYTFLQNHKNKIQKSTHIKAHQKSILLPTKSQSVDSSSLDISLIRYLIQTFNGIKNANKDWKEPAPSDQTLCAYVFRAANFRNQICHDNDVDKMDETTFEKKWEELKKIFQGLKYDENVDDFRTETINYYKLKRLMLKEFVDHLQSYKDECTKEKFQDDYIQRRFYVDRKRGNIAIKSDIVSVYSSESDVESIEEYGESDHPSESDVEIIEECDKSDHSSESDVEIIEECDKSDSSSESVVESIEECDENDDIVIESDLENILIKNDIVMIYAEAGMGKSSTAKRIKKEWCNQNILNEWNVLYFDSKKMNKQLTVRSHAAPLYFSELGHYLEKNGKTEDDLSIYSCVKTTIEKLIILIDGIDEFPVRDLITGTYVDELKRKVKNNEKINAADTIVAIYFGFLFPNTKICLLGRNNEFERLKEFLSNNTNREIKDLELLKFDDANVQEFTCLNICKQQSNGPGNCTSACKDIYEQIKDIELCKTPTDLNSLIKLLKKHPNKDIGRITRTKLIIATLLNRLNEHINRNNYFPSATFGNIRKQKDFSKYLEGILTLGEISFKSLLECNITVRVEEKQDSNNGIVYLEDENKISIERKTLEELDLFYIRDFDYYSILEPHHTLNIEFLSACYLFSHRDEWESILELNKDRQLEIIRFIAGFYADDYFTIDFVKNVFKPSSYSLHQFFSWLYDVNDFRYSLPNGGGYNSYDSYDCWYGLMETQKLSPSFFLLDYISQEVEIPQTFIPKTIVCYSDDAYSSSEWYDMEYLKHNFLTKLSDKLNIELFLDKFPSFKFIIKVGTIGNDEFNRLDRCGENNLVTFRISRLYIYTPLDTCFRSKFNVNTFYIGDECDSRTIDLILNALSPPPTNTSTSNIQPSSKCKRLYIWFIIIDNIELFNDQQTEKLFELCLCGVVDFIALSYTFFTDGQLAILRDVERKTNALINIELYNVNFNVMFGLPNFGNRHVSLGSGCNVTDSSVNKLRCHIPPGYCDNFNDYKIIHPEVPLVRRENYSRDCKQSMFLNWNIVDFTQVSPEVFANTFSIIPSLSCMDNIPSSHWLRLSQIDDCRINEMRIWWPQPENFQHFVNIKTRVSQFICDKDDLKQLLDFIVNNQSIQLDKQIKLFVVKHDLHDWDYYDEITLFSDKTIKEYKHDYSSDNLLLDSIRVSYHEGEILLNNWCCEISLPFEETKDESSIEEIENELSAIRIIGDVVYYKIVKKQSCHEQQL